MCISSDFLENFRGRYLLLQIFESALEKVRHIFLKESFVGCSSWGLFR